MKNTRIRHLVITFLIGIIYPQPCPPADTIHVNSIQSNWDFQFQNNWYGLEVMTWNLKEFPLLDNTTEYHVHEIISDMQPDLIAVQEISDNSDYEFLADNLASYGFIRSEFWGDYAFNLGFAYRLDCISLNYYTNLFYDEGYNFAWRYPLMAHFTWECGDEILDFRVINVHFKAYGDDESFQRRLAASQIIVEYIQAQFESGNTRFIILGDFNDQIHLPESQNSLWPLVSIPETIQFVTEGLTGNSYNNSYILGSGSFIDHIAVSSGLFDFLPGGISQTLRLDDITGFSTYTNQISDHRPVLWKSIINFPEIAEGLVINEIMNNPAAISDQMGEWFEITNTGNQTITLNNYILKDEGQDYHLITSAADLILEPGAFFLLGSNGNTSTNGGLDNIYEYSNYYLSNSFDEIQILHPSGVILDEVWYDNGNTFPDPAGNSMALIDPLLNNNIGSNWLISDNMMTSGDFGTPGSSNFECEEQTWYDDSDGDGLGDPDMWILDCELPDGYVENADDPEPDCTTNDTDSCGICAGSGANGDVNQDNLINVVDVVLVVNQILGFGSLDDIGLCKANINQDEELNIVDVVLIVNLILSINP